MIEVPDIALSVRQPWAWAIIYAGKDIENRSAAAVRHGMVARRICIHASKGMTQDEYEYDGRFIDKTTSGPKVPRPDKLIRGGIIGIVTVIAVVAEHESPWFFGPRGLVLADYVSIEPIPASGQLGYFKWNSIGELDTPKPWMVAWPNEHRRTSTKRKSEPEPAPMPLFD